MHVGHHGNMFVDERQAGDVAKLFLSLFFDFISPRFDRLAVPRRDDSQWSSRWREACVG